MPHGTGAIGGGGPQDMAGPPLSSPLAPISPWGQIPYHGQPVERNITVSGAAIPLIVGDPHRIRLVIAVNQGAATTTGSNLVVISLLPNVTGTAGIPLAGGYPVLVMTWEAWGPLVQQPWFVALASGVTGSVVVTLQTVSLNQWPGDSGCGNLLEQTDALSTAQGRANRNRQFNRLNGTRRLQPAQSADSYIRALVESCQRGFERSGDGNNWLAPDSWRLSRRVR